MPRMRVPAVWLSAGFRSSRHRQECLCHICPASSAQSVYLPQSAFAAQSAHVAQTLLSVLSGTAAAGKSSSQALDDDGDALSAADACRGQPVALPAAAQLVQQGDD